MARKSTNDAGRKKGESRNYLLPGGVERFGRSTMYKKKGVYKKAKVAVKVPKVEKPATKEVPVKGAKNGEKRVVPVQHTSRYYPAEDAKVKKVNKGKPRPPKVRDSLTPGTVVILVSGPYRGKRAVFLKALTSGLLLVTGPFAINGVPIRRVNQAYVIATSTKVDVSGVDTSKFDDGYFKALTKPAKSTDFTEDEAAPQKMELTEERKADQKALDKSIVAAVKKVEHLKAYLSKTFSLSNGQYPHALKF